MFVTWRPFAETCRPAVHVAAVAAAAAATAEPANWRGQTPDFVFFSGAPPVQARSLAFSSTTALHFDKTHFQRPPFFDC